MTLLPGPALCQAQSATAQASPPAPGHADESDWFPLLFAVNAGGGVDLLSPRMASVYAGARLGVSCCETGVHPRESAVTITFDLGFDRVRSRNGVSTEASALFPVLRFPRPAKEDSNYLRLYAAPGAGYRAGGGSFGGYGAVKFVLAFLSDRRIFSGASFPYVEVQRRFPFASPLDGDVRVMIGIMSVVCKHCGID